MPPLTILSKLSSSCILLSLTFFCFLSPVHSQCYSGSYLIGSIPGDDFANVEEAIDSLVTFGMCGSVNLKIESGTYSNSNILIPVIPGNTQNSKLIIESVSGIPNTVILQRGSVSSASNDYVVRLDGIEFVEFRGITIKRNLVSSGYGTIVDLIGSSSSVAFFNTIFQTPSSNYANIELTGSADSVTISGCTFTGGDYGINAFQLTASTLLIENSQFTLHKICGIQFSSGISSTIISGNDITINSTQTTVSAIRGDNVGQDIAITNNVINQSDHSNSTINSSAIYLNSNIPGTFAEISNNFVRTTSFYTHGMYFHAVETVNCNFNTVRTLFHSLRMSYVDTISMSNNILVSSGIGYSFMLDNWDDFFSDYNCFYRSSNPWSVNGVAYSGLSNYQLVTNQENNSIYHSPVFLSSSDFHLGDLVIDGAGNSIPGYTNDIEGDLRQTPPDIGCDEFMAPAIEVSLLNLGNLEQQMCPGMTNLNLNVINLGTNTIDSIRVRIEVGGTVYGYYNWYGSLNSLDTVEISYLSFDFEDLGTYDFEVILEAANGQADAFQFNNSLQVNNVLTKMSGVYSIGWYQGVFDHLPEFMQNVSDRKTCGTVIGEIADGQENQGAGATGFSNLTEDSIILRPMHYTPGGGYVSAINLSSKNITNCSNIFFENLKIYIFHEGIGIGYEISYSNNIHFDNCYFFAAESSYFNSYSKAYLDIDHSDSIFINNCTYRDGILPLIFEHGSHLHFTNNTVINVSSGIMNLLNVDSLFIINNTVDLRSKDAEYAILASSIGYFEIEHNELNLANTIAFQIGTSLSSQARYFVNNSISSKDAYAVGLGATDSIYFVNNSFYNESTTEPIIKSGVSSSNTLHTFFINNCFKRGIDGTLCSGSLPGNLFSDYNAFDPSIVAFSANYTSFGAWSGQGFDLNSQLTNIPYASDYDLRLTGNNLLQNGAITTINNGLDLDNRVRLIPPSIGAYEEQKDTLDVALLPDGFPTGLCGSDPNFELLFTNLGSDTLYLADFRVTLNSFDTIYKTWFGSLAPMDTASLSFGVLDNQFDSIHVPEFTFLPRVNQYDSNQSNNLISHNYFGTPMSGIYYLGGANADFLTLRETFGVIRARGVCDSVFIFVDSLVQFDNINVQEETDQNGCLLGSVDGLDSNYLWIGSTSSVKPIFSNRIGLIELHNTTFENLGFLASNVFNHGIPITDIAQPIYPMQGFFDIQSSDNITIDNCVMQKSVEFVAFHDSSSNISIINSSCIGCDGLVASTPNSYVNDLKCNYNIITDSLYYQYSGINTSSIDGAIIYNLEHIEDLEIIGNDMDDNYFVSSLKIFYSQGKIRIRENKLFGYNRLEYVHGDSSRVQISNNFMVNAPNSASGSALFVLNCANTDIFNNSMNGYMGFGYFDAASIATNRIEKNLVKSSSTSNTIVSMNGLLYCDNNAYSQPPSNSNFDQNTVLYSPTFTSYFDLHLLGNGTIYPQGSFIEIYDSLDFDGDFRTVYSMYGADVVPGTAALDASLYNNVVLFTPCSGSVSIQFQIQNSGTIAIDSIEVAVNLNGLLDTLNFPTFGLVENQILQFTTNPYNIVTNTLYPYTLNIIGINGVSDTVFFNDSVSSSLTYTQMVYTDNVDLCFGDSLLINGVYQSNQGTYTDTLQSLQGCDSIVTYNLNVLPLINASSLVSICVGDSILINGIYQMIPGQYTDTLQSYLGCDSILTITLTNYAVMEYDTIYTCVGDSVQIGTLFETQPGQYLSSIVGQGGCPATLVTELFNYPALNPVPQVVNTSICDGSSIQIGGQIITTSGTYWDTLQNVAGCDSIVQEFHISVIPTYYQIDTFICYGGSIIIDGNTISTDGVYSMVETVGNCQVTTDYVVSTEFEIQTLVIENSGTLNCLNFNALGYQWIDCSSGNIIANETTSSFLPTSPGEYAVVVYEGGCSDTSDCIFMQDAILNEITISDSWSIRPNPTNSRVYIDGVNGLNENIKILTVLGQDITDQLDREQINYGTISIDLSAINPGVYMIELRDTVKMVVKN